MAYSLTNYLTDIRSEVITAVASSGAVGSRVYVEGAVQDNPELPYIVINDNGSSEDDYGVHTAGINASVNEFEVTVHTRTRGQGLELSDLIINYLNNKSGALSNVNIGVIRFRGSFVDYNSETKTVEQLNDFTVYINN